MIRHLWLLAAATAAAMAVASCSGRGDTADNSMTFTTRSGSGTFTLKGTARIFGQDSDIVYSDSVSLLIPQSLRGDVSSELLDSITSIALGETGLPIGQAIERWIETSAKATGYIPVADDNARAADIAQGFDYVFGTVCNLTPDLLVYRIRIESYEAGAAHGMTATRYLNYSIDKGELLTLRRLFTNEGISKLPARIAEQAKATEDVLGPTDITALPANDNFYISSADEIIFAYQPYEVASFAQGQINVSFYPYELIDYLTPEAIAMFGLEDIE